MPRVDRVTFIHPDGRTEAAQSGDVRRDDAGIALWVENKLEPDWVRPGIDVVAAHADGSVEAAFEVANIRRKRVCGTPHRQLYRVYYDY